MDAHGEENHLLTVETDESFESCTRRLSKQLAEYEQTCIDTKGKANQLRKERDAERSKNEKLRKELDKLKNQLLRERTKVASLEKEVKELHADKIEQQETEEGDDGPEKNLQDQNESTDATSHQPLRQEAQERLTEKLQELQNAIEENVERKDKKKTEEQCIALSILIQSLQSYMDVEMETKLQDHEKKISLHDIDSTDDGISCENNNHTLASKGRAKKDISVLFKILVYLGPVFLSLLCYAVFTAKK